MAVSLNLPPECGSLHAATPLVRLHSARMGVSG